jgi:membrane-associated phospholipid phosphatase
MKTLSALRSLAPSTGLMDGRGRSRQRASALLLLAAVTACTDSPTAPVAGLPPTSVRWNALARELVITDRASPPIAGRAYAYLSVAQYAATSVARGIVPLDPSTVVNPVPGLSEAAVASASAQVLSLMFPAHALKINEALAADRAALRGVGSGTLDRANAIATRIVESLGARARTDGWDTRWTGVVPNGPSYWAGSAPQLPTWGQVRPWLWDAGSELRAPPPPAFDSEEFRAALAEVSTIAHARTAEQMQIAEFWADGAGTYTPAGHWNAIAADLIRDAGMTELQAARTLAVMNIAVMDATIGCWDTKFTYWFVRPYQADPSITTPIGQPPHPSYPSGHACMSSAAAEVLASVFPHLASELGRKAVEACDSRVYAGIHYRFDAEGGMGIGVRAAQRAIERADELVLEVARAASADIQITE